MFLVAKLDAGSRLIAGRVSSPAVWLDGYRALSGAEFSPLEPSPVVLPSSDHIRVMVRALVLIVTIGDKDQLNRTETTCGSILRPVMNVSGPPSRPHWLVHWSTETRVTSAALSTAHVV